jgi:hypothetical protein
MPDSPKPGEIPAKMGKKRKGRGARRRKGRERRIERR